MSPPPSSPRSPLSPPSCIERDMKFEARAPLFSSRNITTSNSPSHHPTKNSISSSEFRLAEQQTVPLIVTQRHQEWRFPHRTYPGCVKVVVEDVTSECDDKGFEKVRILRRTRLEFTNGGDNTEEKKGEMEEEEEEEEEIVTNQLENIRSGNELRHNDHDDDLSDSSSVGSDSSSYYDDNDLNNNSSVTNTKTSSSVPPVGSIPSTAPFPAFLSNPSSINPPPPLSSPSPSLLSPSHPLMQHAPSITFVPSHTPPSRNYISSSYVTRSCGDAKSSSIGFLTPTTSSNFH
jgi:hypothetical protein